jgi:hypothetical protein
LNEKVIVIDEDHPHYLEVGTWIGKVRIILGKPMGEILLDSCKHGVKGCLVSPKQIKQLPVKGELG